MSGSSYVIREERKKKVDQWTVTFCAAFGHQYTSEFVDD